MSKLEQLEQVESIKVNPQKTNRLIYLDFLRGFFIIYVLLVHSVTNVVFKTDTGAIDDIKPIVLFILLPLVLIATWAPVFAFISGTANVYVAYRLLERDESEKALRKIISGILINSGFLFLMHLMNQSLFHHSFYYNGELQYTLLTGYVETGSFNFYAELLFYTEAMHVIAMSSLILSVMLYFMWRKGGFKKKGGIS